MSINLHINLLPLLLAEGECVDSSLSSTNCVNWLREVYFCKFWSHEKLSLTFSSRCNLRDIFRSCWIAFMGYLWESRGFRSPAVWVTFLLGWVCRGRGRSVSRLQISTSELAAPPGFSGTCRGIGPRCHRTMEPKPVPPHLAVGCQDGPAVWEVLEKSLCSVRRGAVPAHQPGCPQGLWGKGNKLQTGFPPQFI